MFGSIGSSLLSCQKASRLGTSIAVGILLVAVVGVLTPEVAWASELIASQAEGEVCAVLYLTGDFVVQPSADPDPDMGPAIKVFQDLEYTEYSIDSPPPWRDYGTWLERICFKGNVAPISLAYWFSNEAGDQDYTDYPFTEVDFSGLNTSKLRDVRGVFQGSHIERIDISKMVFPELVRASGAFEDSRLVSFSARGLRTPKLSNAYGLFEECESLRTLTIHNWDAPKLENTGNMFSECHRLRIADFTGMKAQSIRKCSHMFSRCWSLEKVRGIKNLKMEKLRDFSYMYKECKKLERVDLSRWAPSNLMRASAVFGACKCVRHVIVGAGFRKLPSGMFAGMKRGAIVTLQTKKLVKKAVRNCLSYHEEYIDYDDGTFEVEDQYASPRLAKFRVQVGSRSANKSWAAKYSKIFTTKNTGGHKTKIVAAKPLPQAYHR